MKAFLFLLLTLLFYGCDCDIPHGDPLTDYYNHIFGVVTSEWIEADLDFSDRCAEAWDATTLVIDDGKHFKNHCWIEAESDRNINEGAWGCFSHECNPLIVMDVALDEEEKQFTFAHEVVHELGWCSGEGSDTKHDRTIFWDVVLKEAKKQL